MVQNDTVLLSSTYFGPIQWYQKINRYPQVWIEQHEHFVKQTYRNRCIIPTTNGLQALSIPVTCPDNRQLSKTPFRDIRIADHGNWRHIHWNALCSAYGESPFFEYYQDDIHPFFEKKWDFLIDFNHAIIRSNLYHPKRLRWHSIPPLKRPISVTASAPNTPKTTLRLLQNPTTRCINKK